MNSWSVAFIVATSIDFDLARICTAMPSIIEINMSVNMWGSPGRIRPSA